MPSLRQAPAETFRVRRDEIDEQHRTDEMAAGKNRNLEAASFRRPPDEHALKITLLRFVNPEMNLRQRVPAKISAIPAARQTIVSFSDVMRSTSLRSMFLKSN